MPRKAKYQDLREACITEALSIIETSGIEHLSLREVSRRLGVSHQAPYKHFPSRDHILAEVVKRSFEDFAHYLDTRPQNDDPHHNLESMGRTYLQYAIDHPLQYRLMFGTPLPDVQAHPEMMHSAQHTFALLRDCLSQMSLKTTTELDALFVWSVMHGLASLLQTQTMDTLALPQDVLDKAVQHVLLRIGMGLSTSPEDTSRNQT